MAQPRHFSPDHPGGDETLCILILKQNHISQKSATYRKVTICKDQAA